MKNKKFIIFIFVLVAIITSLMGYKLTPKRSIACVHSPIFSSKNIEIIQYEDTSYGKAVLFENKVNGSFGVARLNRHLGFLWKFYGGAFDYYIEEEEPFKVMGIATEDSNKGISTFIIGVKVKNDDIKYIVSGKGPEIPDGGYPEKYALTLSDVKNNSSYYNIGKVIDNYALIVVDEYNESTWTITAFNKQGDLMGDKLFGCDERLFKSN